MPRVARNTNDQNANIAGTAGLTINAENQLPEQNPSVNINDIQINLPPSQP